MRVSRYVVTIEFFGIKSFECNNRIFDKSFCTKEFEFQKLYPENWWMIVRVFNGTVSPEKYSKDVRHQLCNEKFWQMQGLRIMDLGNKCLLRGKLGSISNTYVHSSIRWNTTQFSGILAFKKRLQKPSNNASRKMKKSCVLDQYKYMVYVENYIP